MVNPWAKKKQMQQSQPNTDMFEGMEFSDEGDYQQQQLNIKEIILRHVRKISDICCKEFTGGYWTRKPVKTMGGVLFTEEYNEDVRECYCNAVDFLADMLYPLSDDDLKKYLEENEEIDKDWGEDIKAKLKHKRKTFKQINIMFERINFWGATGVSNE
jgi:hypothetical protein